MDELPGFQELLGRLILHLRQRVRRGELSERSLARLVRCSQPHMHNVLKGSRLLTAEMADRLLGALGIPLITLLTQDELGGVGLPDPVDFAAVPVLQGRLGAGAAFPQPGQAANRFFLPQRLCAAAVSPAVVQLDTRESAMSPFLEPGDWVLLDRSPAVRRRPLFEHAYALSWKTRGYVARCRVVGGALVLVADNPRDNVEIPSQIALAGLNVLDIVNARIAWVGRDL
jgi:transcriptional regulator with XRE-family HTH domain